MEGRGIKVAAELNISKSHKFVLYAPPRCGARYTYTVLRQLGLVGGTQRPGYPAVVSHKVGPPPSPDYRVLACVRNPYTRVLSCWAWARSIKQLPSELPFSDFLRDHAGAWAHPLVDLIGAYMGLIDHVLHLERLDQDIPNLPFCDRKIVFPANPYRSDYHDWRKNWKDFYETQEMWDYVKNRYAQDFVLGGYNPDRQGDLE